MSDPVLDQFLDRGYGWLIEEASERAGRARFTAGRNDIVFTVFVKTDTPDTAEWALGPASEVARLLEEAHPEAGTAIERLRTKLPINEVWLLVYEEDGEGAIFTLPVLVGEMAQSRTLGVVN